MNSFEQIIDRRGTDSEKWQKYHGQDILPLWVADMDFAAPPVVLEALQRRVAHGVFGYPRPWPSLVESVLAYLQTTYQWTIKAEWIVWLPGLVTGLNVACRAVEGDVLTNTPVYPPFLSAPRHGRRRLQTVDLLPTPDGWRMDWEAMARRVTAATGLFLFCHPHNPVGRCWSEAELRQLAAFCGERDIVVCSDEIHCDLILEPGRRHRPYASLSNAAARHSITLMAPSKTFNVPGLGCAFAVIPRASLRRRFLRAMSGIVPNVNVLGLVACEAAFRGASAWRAELLDTLRRNRDAVEAAVARLPGLSMHHGEATYLAWIDARGLGLDDPAGHFERHGLGLSDGRAFGAPGWMRLNFGCPPATLADALARLETACLAAR